RGGTLSPEQDQIQSRVAIVTGAAGGLGGAVARRLAAAGDTVIGVDREAVEIDGVEPLRADLGDWEGCERVGAETVARHGPVDVLVNCAAILRRTELDDVDAATFETVFNVNCRSALVLSRAALRDMERRRWGRIVNVTSIGVHTGGYSLTSTLYEATKA